MLKVVYWATDQPSLFQDALIAFGVVLYEVTKEDLSEETVVKIWTLQ